jgi:hypothetical protein
MARHRKQAVTALGIQAKKEPGYYADGNGLYLRVATGGTKSWIFRYMLRGRAREMGLGSVLYKPLAQAREEVVQYHQLLLAYIDPIEHRKAQREKVGDAARKLQTFASVLLSIMQRTAAPGATLSHASNGSIHW